MRAISVMRYGAIGLALAGAGVLALGGAAPTAQGQTTFIQDGHAGFVVAHFEYALSRDAVDTGACPNGMTQGYLSAAEADANRPLFNERATAPNGQNLCMNPEAGQPDPKFRVVTGPNVPAWGINLDGQNSRANGRPAPSTCAHDDFRGMNGERGIDNQFFRVVGCSNSFQSTGQSNGIGGGILVGEWGLLIALDGLDDIRNDADVEVKLYASADPIALSPNREAIPSATYAVDQDPRFRVTARGRLVNGLLTTEPVDFQFRHVVNSIRLVRPLLDARVMLTLSADGALEGYLAGYTPVEAMYDVQYGFRNGKDGVGEPAPLRLRMGSSVGQARVQGHTCQGAYYALYQNADGRPDANGRCTAISTQYRIRAIPAFVVDVQTRSLNEGLVN